MSPLSHLDIGQIGENATLQHYQKLGYKLVVKNYWKPFGEIDVIVRNDQELIFIEVKSVSCNSFAVTSPDTANPAENIHHKKRARLRKAIGAFFVEYPRFAPKWRVDVALVRVNTKAKLARIEILPDVIL